MNARVTSILIASTGCVLALFLFELAQLAPKVLTLRFGDALRQTPELIPAPTTFAVKNYWVFITAIATISFYVLIRLRRATERPLEIIATGLSAQGLITWLAMFCFCFDGFKAGFCMHDEPEFEFVQFVSFAHGFFPITLLLIAAPALAVVVTRRSRS